MDAPPVIDFTKCGLGNETITDEDLKLAGNELYKAFSTSGFAYLSGSGISDGMVNKLNELSGEFFKKNMEYKDTFLGNIKFGYEKLGFITNNPARPSDYAETFHVGGDCFFDKNLSWPDVPGLAEFSRDFAVMCETISIRLMKSLALGMKLCDPLILENSHKRMHKNDNHTCLRMLNYPGISDSDVIQKDQVRCGEHSDWGTLTLLFQDDCGGLQIQKLDGTFIDVTPLPETIVVNIGDMLSLWSENVLKSTVHRVVIPTDPIKRAKPRKSIAYFVNADDDTLLTRLQYLSMESKSNHKLTKNCQDHMTAIDYLNGKFEAFFGKNYEAAGIDGKMLSDAAN